MENLKLVYFEPDAANPHAGNLFIDKSCILDDIYQFPATPRILKSTLDKMITWHTRNETTIGKALRSLHRFPQLQAYILALGIDTQLDPLMIPIDSENLRVASSDVRATPADEPIVAVFMSLKVIDGDIASLRISVTGAHSKSPYLLTASKSFIGKRAETTLLDDLVRLAGDELKPESDYLGSAEYRLAMEKIAIKRAFIQCLEAK